MNDEQNFSPKIVANPFYAVRINDHFFTSPVPKTSSEDWVLLNAHLIEDIGASAWLGEFLDVISQSSDEYDGHDIINPILVTTLSTSLQGDHECLISREDWISTNTRLMSDLGAPKWLELLLNVLGK